VQNYRLYKNGQLAYVATIDDKQVVGIYDDGKVIEVQRYDTIEPTVAELARYTNDDYLAVARGEQVVIYSQPLSGRGGSPLRLSSPGGVDLFTFSPEGRFVVAASGKNVVSYDLEMNERYAFELNDAVVSFNWIDEHHLADTSGGQIAWVEFDGANREFIVSGRGRAVLSDDEKYLFSLSDTTGGVVLQRSAMVIK
jgi:hypothetical protein